MKEMIGNIVDAYKVEMLLEEFKKEGIHVVKVEDFMPGIKNVVCHSEQTKVKPIIDKITQHFIDKYKKK